MIHDAQALADPLPGSGRVQVYQTMQTTPSLVSLGTLDADVLAFSGFPDSIEVLVLDNAAIVTLTDGVNRESDPVRVPAGTWYDSQMRARKVRARNETAGLVARVQVIGKWLAEEIKGKKEEIASAG